MQIFTEEQVVKFESAWLSHNKHHEYDKEDELSDSEYLDYKIWEDMNWKDLYKKHLPNTLVARGDNPNIIFHGGCLSCISQRNNGIERCKGCTYFRFDHSKPNLFIPGEKSATMSGDDFLKLLGGL